ncbi:hypothetical protein VW23_009445 [Devosia insulae DS-56]|uniref:Uncharacterized protein n=1 Tax=Devosia insulae DS-56 TaxID=1116389 RepID=A0A1E5XW78_9HYPH|nr:hypothetical protein [Devosia insulae]OEO32843.1 hypothetical protein VW23_009445 [Devosia insulae DS-56]
MNANLRALFYAADIAPLALQLYVFGSSEPPAIDVIDFPDEAGGTQLREFALPYLPGMDEIALTSAELAFRVGDLTVDVTDYSTVRGPGGEGVILNLPAHARLRQVEMSFATPPATTVPPPVLRTVVRPLQGGQPGPPILSSPPLGPATKMFGSPLEGMSVDPLGGSRYLLRLPDLPGTTWLFQRAKGDDATSLEPLSVVPTITRVAIAAAPRNLAITLEGTPPTPLWSNPDVLLPGSGIQTVSFLPIAQRRLSDTLPAVPPGTLTLPLRLDFTTESSARLEVTARRLSGEYLVRPFGPDPLKLRLAARPVPVVFDAPAARRPSTVRATITAKLLGRALNGGSEPAVYTLPGRGLRATLDRMLAARLPIAARRGEAASAPVPLASLALRLDTPEASEIVLELRSDAAGQPGGIIGTPVVRQTPAGYTDWLEFEHADTLLLPAGLPIWATIRLTKGAALWHAADPSSADTPGTPRVSTDRGTSWLAADSPLEQLRPLLVQAFHREDRPYRPPRIVLHSGTAPVSGDLLQGAVAEGNTQFRLVEASLPAAVLDRLANAAPVSGRPRAETSILLYSDTVLDLVLSDVVLSYAPVPA